ncbi:MAG: methionyl-tRNA formyltransferase [SAR324 cluster bacterium]|uniref:Methionyl-tRNA formyltransferase n=1 Tax=SAR324 cluster bacterium TaxID=2024889 RepID=A0A7X9IJC4_9DELT|nr:methionyl-tRNA formyltransferase [SAR324 cluster bacterium]
MSTNSLSVIFFGTPTLASYILSLLLHNKNFDVKGLITQQDKAAGRGNKLKPPPTKVLASEFGIPIFQPHKLKAELPSLLASLDTLGPIDFAVIVAYGQILPKELLSLPRFGCINVHASLLPRWRGAAPIQRAIMAGDSETGVSIMQMTEGLDCGPVYASETIAIAEQDNFQTLHDRIAEVGGRLIIQSLPAIAEGKLHSTPQTSEGVTYASKLLKEEEVINWNRDASEIRNLIRALCPAPGAYTLLNGRRLKILKAELLYVDSPENVNKAGTVVFFDKNALHISCGHGILSVLEVQPEGKRPMSVKDFISGASLHIGQIFGK